MCLCCVSVRLSMVQSVSVCLDAEQSQSAVGQLINDAIHHSSCRSAARSVQVFVRKFLSKFAIPREFVQSRPVRRDGSNQGVMT